MDKRWRSLKAGDRVRLIRVPDADLQQRERETADGAELAGLAADTLEKIMTIDPVVAIDHVDEWGVPWFCRNLVGADGVMEHHYLAITDDESWEPIADD